MSSGFLTTEHVYIICKANFFVLGVPVHRFECCCFLTGISHRFYFFVLEHQQMKSNGGTVRTTAHTLRAYEYDDVRRQQ